MTPTPYIPQLIDRPSRLLPVPTAWNDCESVIADIIYQFGITPKLALEFGVDYGYSTAALANYFTNVIGVDTFMGDINAGDRGEDGIYAQVKQSLIPFPNVLLVKERFEDFIQRPFPIRPDLIHVDIVHDYTSTYNCGEWAIANSDVVIFHDTLSFPDVYRAVHDLAVNYGRNFYNWEHRHGLGILSKKAVGE